MTRLTASVITAAVLGLATGPARALDWSRLWLNTDQRGAASMEQKNYAEAARTFDNPRWRAAAWYRAGEYERAAEAWAGMDDTQAHYNRGNALARAGKLEAAIAAYETVLERESDHADARHNLTLLRELTQQDEADSADQRRTPDADGDRDPSQPGQRSSGGERDDQSPERSGDPDEPAGNQPDTGQGDQRKSTPRRSGDEETSAPAAGQHAPEAGPPEAEAAMEQWLRRVPDDPGGLLRRKFLYQYNRRDRDDGVDEPW